ncbi:MAG TPA: molybdenum cofactor biosynthesis protein MoaE [Acidisarcina sp.]
MRVRVLYFGALKDIFFKDRETIELPRNASVATLLDHYRNIAPGQGNFWDILAVAVNTEYALPAQSLNDGDEVALLPPVSGGSGAASSRDSNGNAAGGSATVSSVELNPASDGGQQRASHIALVRDAINAAKLTTAVKRGEDGAVVVFDGIVRNNTRGRRTLFLVYEAYEEMALAQMRKLAQDAMERFGVLGVTIVHRLGKLDVGETSVLIAVSSAHRAPAFDACRWLIDTLKKTVPIWKKEHFEDGAVWADGEPFPEGVVAALREPAP